MRRARGGASETGNHPFRSMFDLMLVLVFLLTGLLLLGRRPGAAYDARPLEQELLLLHNVDRRASGSHTLLNNLHELSKGDPCYRVSANGGFLSAGEQRTLETHRRELWTRLEAPIKDQLLAEKVTQVVGQDVLQFPSGAAVPLNPERRATILAEAYRNYRTGYRRIRVEGHTDNVRMASVQFPSNWELSAARAIWLAKEIEGYFAARGVRSGEGGVEVLAVGYGERKPRVPNDSEEHRRLNRRIEIVFER